MGNFELDIPKYLHRSWYNDKENWILSAHAVHDLLCEIGGAGTLASKSVLDYGCGSKLTKLLLENDLPIKRYVGVDTMKPLIDFLQESVPDPRFGYHHLNIYNELYNREGTPFTSISGLPLGTEQFDIICLFSVFTHLAPHDYRPLLELLRPHASENCRLVYSIFLNEKTAGGHGQVDKWGPLLEAHGEFPEGIEAPDFCDFFPDKPLRVALYARPYAMKLLEGTGWKIEDVRDPTPHIQHVFVCTPD